MSTSEHTSPTRSAEGPEASRNPFVAILRFVREVIAELRKVVAPTGRELGVYTVTVLGFVLFMILLVFGLDVAFGWLADLAFTVGGPGA